MNNKVLIIDDDPIIIEFVSEILLSQNIEVFDSDNGAFGYCLAKEINPDLIITDWEMPVLNGIETLIKLKGTPETKEIPVIVMTGKMTSSPDLKLAFESGAIDFIHKPIEPIELIARTKSMLKLSNYHKELVKKKDWELTILSKTNYQNEILFTQLLQEVEKFHQGYKVSDEIEFKNLKKNLNAIKSNFKNKSWEQFEQQFGKVHPSFSTNLLIAFPKLSPEEIRLCYYLKMNMSSKEIATITNIEMQSVDIARYRLRKKLNLQRGIKLNGFLSQF